MSEIRNNAMRQINCILNPPFNTPRSENAAREILAILEIAVVNREAALPESDWESSVASAVYHDAQQDMLEAGWVKEING